MGGRAGEPWRCCCLESLRLSSPPQSADGPGAWSGMRRGARLPAPWSPSLLLALPPAAAPVLAALESDWRQFLLREADLSVL